MKQLFDSLDLDGSGDVGRDELLLMFETAGLIIDVQLIEKMFQRTLNPTLSFKSI